MKFMRTISLIALAMALSLGFFASGAQAAFLDSVRVVTPDSAGVRGIDSLITARAYFWTGGTADDSTIQVLFWIADKEDMTQALMDSTGARGAVEDSLSAVFSVGGTPSVATPDFVAAGATIGSAGNDFALSDADTVIFAPGAAAVGSGYVAEVRIPVPESKVGEVSNLTVWATVYDPTAVGSQSAPRGYSTPLGDTKWFKVDGIRPLADPNKVRLDTVIARGPARFVQTTSNGVVRALGAGDTMQVVYDLGTAFQDIYGLGLRASSQFYYRGDTLTIDLGTIAKQINTVNVLITPDMFGDLTAADSTGAVGLFLTDTAGNLSNTYVGGPAAGLTKSADFVIDAVAPELTEATGDTIYPADGDTITDGGIDTGGTLDDQNPVSYKLQEPLAKLSLTFDNADDTKDRSVVLTSFAAGTTSTDPFQFGTGALQAGQSFHLNLTKAANDSVTATVLNGADVAQAVSTTQIPALATGTYTLKVQGTDFAGNVGSEQSIANVYLDVDDIVLQDRFPTKLAFGPTDEARTDTIEESTSIVTFQLSEPADSVVIRYTKVSGPDTQPVRTYVLSADELTRTDTPQSFPVDSLVNLTEYELTILARDLAGNYTVTEPDTFLYDTSFVVPLIQRFAVAANPAKVGLTPANHLAAGDTLVLNITADATLDGSRDAVTFKQAAVVKVEKVSGGVATGVTLTGSGVTDEGNGRASLDADGWLAGKRSLVLKDVTAVDTLKVTVVDSADATPYVGTLDSLVVFDPAAYTKILVDAPAEVNQGDAFTVGVKLADEFGNTRVLDNRYVNLSVNKAGVDLPAGALYVTNGQGSFTANATGWAGTGLVFQVIDMVDANGTGTIRAGSSDSVTVLSGAAVAVDAPDTLAAEDYMGADGTGDQGGFIMLTWDLSDDHSSLSGYRIYREVMVDTRAGGEGEPAIVQLDTPANQWIVWGKVDAVPGQTLGRAVVATLDNVATRWAIAAEKGGSTSAVTAKKAFDGSGDVSTAYELMTQTMMQSKRAAAQVVDGPVFASLSPEALSFMETGVVPQMKSVTGNVALSTLTATAEPVAAVDNIAPEAVAVVHAMDTPNDAGGSVTVTWAKSASDALVSRNVPNAVGLNLGDAVQGVKGYNIYRQAGTGEFELVGKAGPGETSFVDRTAVNGVRYTYEVRPYDDDNEAPAVAKFAAMAIRNNVMDKAGNPVFGLFGTDNTVGFDDFFLFADRFGQTAEDASFEPAFDLVADGRIDSKDFFLFADNFGKVADVAAAKTVPGLAGLNSDARLYLDAGEELPTVGENVVVAVNLADFAEVKGYGLKVTYDPEVLEFVKIADDASTLGDGALAAPQVISKSDGQLSVVAYGETVTQGKVGLNLVFRTKAEIEGTYVEVAASEVQDGNYGVNEVALPAPVQIQTRPEVYALGNNYPNPFNPSTTIKYALPEGAFVKLQVYNVVGQVVRTLVADQQRAGRYVVEWDATNDRGQALSSGIYFYRLQAGNQFLEVKKMLLLK